jgi:hypothetical protein
VTFSRRQFLAGTAAVAAVGAVGGLAARRAGEASTGVDVVLTTDFTVNPSGDPDDAYDLVCARAMGIQRVVLDMPKAESIAAIRELGLYAATPETLGTADAVVVLGSPTNAAKSYRVGQRVVLFAGDYTGQPEYNQQLDPAAYDYLRAQRNTYWVPCFQGGLWASGPHASYVQTTDDALTTGIPKARDWLRPKFADRWGTRNLWAGPLLNFAFDNSWGANTFNPSRAFVASPHLVSDMVGGTRRLLTQF